MHTKKIRRSREDVIFDAVFFIILTLIFIIVAYPLYFIIISSVSDPKAVAGGKVIFYPIGLNFKGYAEVFKDSRIIRSFLNSLFYTFCGTMLNLAVTLPTAYALSRKKFFLKKPVTIFYMITMFLSGGMIPTYLVVQKTGLLDTMWSLIIPGALSVYNMIVAWTFFQQNISEELYEAAELDGCGHGKFFFSVALPLSGSPDNLHLGYLAGYFGCSIDNNGFTMDGDQLVFGAASEAYKKGMEYLASLYAEGLIDPELFTQDSATWKSKGGQDLYGVCIMYGCGDIVQQDDVTVMPDWTPLPVLKSEGVENPVWLRNTYGIIVLKNQVVITDNAEHPEVICRWWDNFFELDNSVMSQNGVLDEVLFKQEDGSYTKIDITKESQEVQERNDWGNLWAQSLPKYIPEGFKVKEELEPVYNETEYRDSVYEPYLTEKCVPDQWPDLEHSEEIAELEASIKDYITQCQAKWVAGQSDINADWDGYLEQLDKLGLDQYLEYKGAVKAE